MTVRRLSRSAQWLLLGAGLLLLGGVIAWMLYADYRAIESRERERLASHAKVIDENLGRQLLATSLALDSIRRSLALLMPQRDGQPTLNRRLKSMSETMPGVRTLLIVDAGGSVIAADREELVGQNFREREYFQTARRSSDAAALHVSPPFRTVLGVFAINLVKVIPGKRGEFAGIVAATLDPDYFSTLLTSVLDGPDMWSSLAHGDGKLLVMIPPRPGTEGADLAKPGSFYTRHSASGESATVMTGIVHATGQEVMMAQRIIKPAGLAMDKDLRVAVARDLSSIFAGWRRAVMLYGGLFGILCLTSTLALTLLQRQHRAYDQLAAARESERKLLEEALARRAAELAALYAALQTVREEERERFARELHDDLGHLLTALKMDLEWLAFRLPAQSDRVAAKLESTGLLINQIVDSVRRIMDDLRPVLLDQLGLTAALQNYVTKFVARTGIHCDLSADDQPLGDKLGIQIFRIVQEALNNIHMHARASRVSISLQRGGDAVMLAIEDNGAGLPEAPAEEGKGFGVLGMRERVHILNGHFSMTSEEGRGTRIEVTIPG